MQTIDRHELEHHRMTAAAAQRADHHGSAEQLAAPRPAWRRAVGVAGTAAAGALVVLLLAALADIARIDPTSGGYEPPYTGVVGEPIDWDGDTATTATGMVRTGHVLDVHTDCTTGMISLEVFGLFTVDYRELSPRALAVHDPREACVARGFTPRF